MDICAKYISLFLETTNVVLPAHMTCSQYLTGVHSTSLSPTSFILPHTNSDSSMKEFLPTFFSW